MQAFEFAFRPGPRRSCKVRVGSAALERLADELTGEPAGQPLVLISDTNVAPLHAARLERLLRERGLSPVLLCFPAGESSKSRETKAWLEDRLFELGAGRDAWLVAVGGGVTCDLAGFLASTWYRGITVVQVPTSLLAMVDAGLGGKTAVNLPGGKNLVGSFHQPWGVYADIDVLSTLAEAEYVEGFAEVVKTAAIADPELFRWLESSVGELLHREPGALSQVVERCLRIKGLVVARDEREARIRAMLNFGHTIAHALEAASGFTLRHGAAVATGMCLEARLAVAATGFPEPHVERLESLLVAFGLPIRPPADLSVEALVAATYRDKKARRRRVHYALPRRLGRMPAAARLTVVVDEPVLRDLLQALAPGSASGVTAKPRAPADH